MIRSNLKTIGGDLGKGEFVAIGTVNGLSKGTLTNDTYNTTSSETSAIIIGVSGYNTLTSSGTLTGRIVGFNDNVDAAVIDLTGGTPASISDYSFIMILNVTSDRTLTFA